MTAEQIGLVTTLLNLLDKVGSLPFGMILIAIIIGPWVLSLLLAYLYNKRFEALARMYEDNVILVEHYETLAKDHKDVVIMNTTAMTKMIDAINTNQYCPLNRLQKAATGVVK